MNERPLRVLLCTLRYPPYVEGGYELRLHDLVRALRARGHEVRLLCGEGERFDDDVLARLRPCLDGDEADFGRALVASNAERVRLHLFRLGNYQATRRALAEFPCDVFYYANLSLLSLAPLLAAQHAGVPRVGDVSDPWPLCHWRIAWREGLRQAGRDEGWKLRALDDFYRALRDLVGLGHMLVPSDYLRQRFADDGMRADSIEVHPTALAPDFASPERLARPIRERRGGEPLRVVYAGSLWEGKGVHVLIKAAARAAAALAGAGAPLELVVIGDGPRAYRERLGALAAAAETADGGARVRFAGRLSRASVAEELERAHVFCFPSAWGEPFARATLEAMACGVPVVVARSGANAEQVDEGRSGLVVDPADAGAWASALIELARDEPRRQRLAAAGRERLQSCYGFDRWVGGVERALAVAAGRHAA